VVLGVDDVAEELIGVRDASVGAITAASEAFGTGETFDLDAVAAQCLETTAGTASLALRCLEMARRKGVGPLTETDVEWLEGILEEAARMLPRTRRAVWGR